MRRFIGKVDGQTIVTIREPFLDGARVLAERGYDPQTPGNVRHANSSTLLL
jgi:hypothetical protein